MPTNAKRRGANAALSEPLRANVTQPSAAVNSALQLEIRAAVAAELAPVIELLDGIGQTAPRYLTSDEMCVVLQITRPTLRKLLEDGMPHLRLGETRRFVPSAVEQWLSERAKAGAT